MRMRAYSPEQARQAFGALVLLVAVWAAVVVGMIWVCGGPLSAP